MSYCRFHNTVLDLQDCQEKLNDLRSISAAKEELSKFEFASMKELVKMCKEIADDFYEQIEEVEH